MLSVVFLRLPGFVSLNGLDGCFFLFPPVVRQGSLSIPGVCGGISVRGQLHLFSHRKLNTQFGGG
jgi:hypothetical protein